MVVSIVGLSRPGGANAATDPLAVAQRAAAVLTQPPIPFAGGAYDGDDGLTRWGDDRPIDDVIAFGHVLHVAGRPDVVDSSGPRVLAADYRRAFPDLVLTVQGVDLIGERVTVRWSLRGTVRGSFAGLAPTGPPYEEAGAFVFRLDGGRVTETWVEARTADLLRQAGAEPLPAESVLLPATDPHGPSDPYVPMIEDNPYTGR